MTSKKIVEAGYDELKSRYGQWTLTVDPRHRIDYLERLMELLSARSRVLELGCGPGIPIGIEIEDDQDVMFLWVIGQRLGLGAQTR